MEISKTLFGCGDIGINSIIFLVTDKQGNFAFKTLIVNVLDSQDYCSCNGIAFNSSEQSLSEGTFLAINNIVSDATIANNKTAFYQAGESITLTEGFHAVAGSDFTARIGGCSDNESTINAPLVQRNNSQIHSNSLKELNLKVSPNPFQQETLVSFNLAKTSETSLIVISATGQELQSILEKEWLDAGDYQFNLDANTLPTGLLYIQLHVNGETITKKMIRIQ